MMFLAALTAQAQISIGGSIYGGGNAGDTGGSTKVTVYEGNLHAVFAGARMANVGGSAFVHIDGEHASDYILADYVYGGNDIAGTIGTSTTLPVDENNQSILTETEENHIDNTWNAFVRISSKTTTGDELPNNAKVYIGQLFGGGNGYYDYNSETTGEGSSAVTTYQAKDKATGDVVASSTNELSAPELGKAYLELKGGSIVYAYAGGNNATITENTVVCLDNPSKVVSYIKDTRVTTEDDGELLTAARFKKMRINTGFSYPSSDAFQIGCFFGGNNKAEMAIRPTWNLKRGLIRNLYSGGNEGAMTHPKGIYLVLNSPDLKVDNVYGGCRMANVNPAKNAIEEETIGGTRFPAGYAARLLITAGDINNVYGGNDITGNVYGGNAVGIHCSIKGDVYGGGNGSYPYTDNPDLANHDIFGDLYYDPGSSSVDALKSFRPNAESVSIRVVGQYEKDAQGNVIESSVVPTVIGGAIYCGGNNATLHSDDPTKDVAAELKIGSYVIADRAFLGNNGANMKDEDILEHYAKSVDDAGNVVDSGGKDFSQMDLTNKDEFEKYMDAVAMDVKPRIAFDAIKNKDPQDYIPYSTKFGSFYCGGNVGSMKVNGAETLNFDEKVIVFDKLVGGSNDANIYAKPGLNAEYLGGLLGEPDANGNKLTLNFNGLKIQPMRWVIERDENTYEPVLDANGNVQYILDANGNRQLEWNTISASTGKDVAPVTTLTPDAGKDYATSTSDDLDRRFKGGNIYGGCYNTGHVNGNVIINLDASLEDRKGDDAIFDQVEQNEGEAILYGKDSYKILQRRSGVLLDEQGMDVLGKALNVFGGGYGSGSEIWGSTTINLNAGYTFQIFGGGERGAIGHGTYNATAEKIEYNTYDPKYSCYVNLKGADAGVYRGHADDKTNMAEAEFIYGGSFEAPICGNTVINLGNGRIFNSFAGSCNADILGHTETYIGRSGVDANGNDILGFPWVRDHVYGGNDLGGRILRDSSFISRVSDAAKAKMHNPKPTATADVAKASAYMEYIQGRVDYIFGGCYGDYDYKDRYFKDYTYDDGRSKPGFTKPRLDNAFVNFKANNHTRNALNRIFGAGQGSLKGYGVDSMQNRSYILVDIPNAGTRFQNVEVFGAGANCGLGMGADSTTVAANPDKYTAIIDLFRGDINNVYGGSFTEGFTRRTIVNVPSTSAIKVQNLFGGAYGADPLYPCDVYESHVNYHSADATVARNIYGGNNQADRTLYAQVNISTPVYNGASDPKTGTKYMASVFGAGYGEDSWAQYTEVNLLNGAQVYEVYGGGHNGKVINSRSLLKWKENDPTLDISMPGYEESGLDHKTLVHATRLGGKYNTNVHINEGATVWNYAYGGGQGDSIKVKNGILGSGDVYGTTYIDLLGGTVNKDLYAAGTSGGVRDSLRVTSSGFDTAGGRHIEGFTASSTAYIEGGKARNVYGGGWRGSVGYHLGGVNATTADDIPGETHVIIGKLDGTSFINGIPAIERNAYGGGEGGAVFGTTNITLNNGFIGYRHFDEEPSGDLDTLQVWSGTDTNIKKDYYQEKLHDETWSGDGTNRLNDSGCVFGGGYIDNSNVDVTNVKMYGGVVRNSLFGGGEIAAIGRGIIHASGQDNSVRTLQGIYKAGKTNVELYEGHVHRNVFGGGRGYNNLGKGGTLYSDGYVFGQTEVHVFGGTVGTVKELARENGNVFGGGDIGYVYSAYEKDGDLYVGIKDGERYKTQYEGYYYAYKKGSEAYTPGALPDASDENWVKDDEEYVLTEDCKVLIEPHPKALSAVTINSHSYAAGEYVTTEDLNTLGNKNDTKWNSLDPAGIIIFNAVFAGGNTSSGSSAVYANSTTVFGNATASVHDVYHRDLITLGTGRTGGLYGDGNLTFVDGYRGLNITNYGTDYYSIDPEIDYDTYDKLPDREAAYYQVKYKCIKECTDKDQTTYYPEGGEHTKASTLTIDDLLTLFEGIKQGDDDMLLQNPTTGEWYPNPNYWEQNGVLSIYAGRLMNTIQRADFCGVFGSRMVMQGAQDRVPEIVDHTNYTINRVREVSLNQKKSVIATDASDPIKKVHGNYFGIYSIVNYLGALTSDVFFMPDKDVRVTDNVSNPDYRTDSKAYDGGTSKAYGSATYYDWKAGFVNERKRNNGTSMNKVALASGVYLELTTEQSTGNELNQKDWGYITGVVELDLINVQPGVGGGFVYAKNVHKTGSYTKSKHNTLTALNEEAITRRDFTYEGADVEWETSGNFIHSTQTIIDDCYNISGKYKGADAVPAHYWFIKGSVYVYDQYISAYTGAPNAYSEAVEIPLTITAASHGTMKLLNVQPNKYAYYSAPNTKMGKDQKIVINDIEYHLNDPINYWDWYLLTNSEKNLFVDETYVTIADCKYSSEDADTIHAGTVMLPEEYTTAKTAHPKVYHVEKKENVDFDFVFRSSNNMRHDTGYMLTYKVNNPTDWNTWYTKAQGTPTEKSLTNGDGYEDGPTYHLTSGTAGILGQREYKVSNLISKETYDTYQAMSTSHPEALPSGQATFENAFIVTQEYTSGDTHLNVGSAVSATAAASMTGYVAPAYICTSTIALSKTEFIYVGTRMTEAEKTTYYNTYKDSNPALAAVIKSDIVPAYYCTVDGLYGGNYYEADRNYRGLEVWSSMSKTDREKFSFNYDAFDLLIDRNYGNAQGHKYQYDATEGTKAAAEANPAGYSLERPVDYTATYNGDATTTHNGVTLKKNQEYTREQFEKLPNEKRHYTAIDVKEAGSVYVVKTAFQVGNSPYAVGTVISSSTYGSLGDSDKNNITTLKFTENDKNKTFYYCRESYEVGKNTEGVTVTSAGISGGVSGEYTNGKTVPVGLVITDGNYNELANWQTDFSIHGIAPTETSTLYVSRFSDIFDLSKEKIITVIYEYNYEESDASGAHVTPVSERHVVNIHVEFKSGIPSVEDIKAPQIVLPGTYVGIREPHVTPGAYEVTGGGWKLFEKKSDAESHVNGIEYTPTANPLYWYQDGYYLAYYAKTYLGETYSNTVQVSVANYHDLTKVMGDTQHHYYVDNKNVKRKSKIYITDATNGASQFKQFFDLTVSNGSPAVLDAYVENCRNLEFFMRTNVSVPSGSPAWTPIGDATNCFAGNFHGDGYRIDGLDNSLFGNLCGNVYNLGVTGSFTSAGVADEGDGYVENCWINTSATSGFPDGVKAVFGNPTASGKKIVNCYYPEGLNYSTTDNSHGLARPMPLPAFYNGTVAYDLNGFYLYKRYSDKKITEGTAYKYYTISDDGTLSEPQTKHYATNPEYCSSGYVNVYPAGGYVEERYADGDFVYAGGTIPEAYDERMSVDDNDDTHFYPIWPDDYIFFGQTLTYGYSASQAHQDWPTNISKSGGRLPVTESSNRVYRAPAYYQSKEMSLAHYNLYAYLAAYSKPKTHTDTDLKEAYPNMTAIDFCGHNDTQWTLGTVSSGSPAGTAKFYTPLLDAPDSLLNVANEGETPNLLVYAPSVDTYKKTHQVLTATFADPVYTSSYIDNSYRCVKAADAGGIHGHLVQSDRTATNDHLLVDKKDFNCPLSYTFAEGKRMWYQRTPDRYVDTSKGWETVSLPFTAELVTTQQKGEITHFYSGSPSFDKNGTKIGHEYWLREFKAITVPSGSPAGVLSATFNYPDATGATKNVGNTFLWEYYYSKNTQQDANADTYQTYYNSSRNYEAYPLLATAKPYIIGFPGKTYYEFDLSGEWTAKNTAPTTPAKLDKQTISFVSESGITIAVSDDETTAISADGYSFMRNYMSKKVDGYLMNGQGNSFEKTTTATAAVPFRPYFVKTQTQGSSPRRAEVRYILFDSDDSSFAIGDDDPGEGEVSGGLQFAVRNHAIVVTSSLRKEADVRIVKVSGQTIADFNIQPGESIETPVYNSGVYIIRAASGHYTKKIAVK
ncbi:MAG: T9SS type A sorting domain-containing protein [Prevotella sp.]|nr:T9SS type A sorting domain-containing protein [Prevotella sp.]